MKDIVNQIQICQLSEEIAELMIFLILRSNKQLTLSTLGSYIGIRQKSAKKNTDWNLITKVRLTARRALYLCNHEYRIRVGRQPGALCPSQENEIDRIQNFGRRVSDNINRNSEGKY